MQIDRLNYMLMRPIIVTLMLLSVLGEGCGNDSSSNFKIIDDYLSIWDHFAQGANELASQVKRDKPRFEKQLAVALSREDKRAPSRLIFYAVVQVGEFIPCESELGRACEKLVRGDCPVFTSGKGERMYFAGDLYFWWERHKTEFDAFSLYEEWRGREFATNVVIPMYESAAKKQ